MKKYYLRIITILILFFSLAYAQEERGTIFKIPAIGDTLDKEERDFYKLFPNIKDFEYAVFYIDEKDAVTAKVFYRVLGKIEYRNYENYMAGLQNFNRYTEQIDKVSASTSGGKEITFYLINNNVLTGELISVRQNSILIFPAQGGINLIDDRDHITVLNKSDILKIEIPNDRNFFGNCLLSSYTGGAIVSLLAFGVASLATKNESESNYTPELIGLIGWVIGTVVTYLIISGDNEIKIDWDYDLGDLKEYARFKNFEPMYLRQNE